MAQRILQGAAAVLSYELEDADGIPTAAAGTVTVGVTSSDGTVILAAGTATSSTTTGIYTVALTSAMTAQLDELTATWVDSGGGTRLTSHSIVGGFVLPMSKIRAFENLGDLSRYPNSLVISCRSEVEDELENICDRAFVPRFRRITVDGAGDYELLTAVHDIRTIRSLRVFADPSQTSYQDLTTGSLTTLIASSSGVIRRSDLSAFTEGVGNVIIGAEYGFTNWGGELRRAALIRLRDVLNRPDSKVPERASSYTDQNGFGFQLKANDDEWETGIDEVDRIYARYSLRTGRGTDRDDSFTITNEVESRWGRNLSSCLVPEAGWYY